MTRLENHLSLDDICKRTKLLGDTKIASSTANVLERVKDPKIEIKDVYDKIVYDTVRRKQDSGQSAIYLSK